MVRGRQRCCWYTAPTHSVTVQQQRKHQLRKNYSVNTEAWPQWALPRSNLRSTWHHVVHFIKQPLDVQMWQERLGVASGELAVGQRSTTARAALVTAAETGRRWGDDDALHLHVSSRHRVRRIYSPCLRATAPRRMTLAPPGRLAQSHSGGSQFSFPTNTATGINKKFREGNETQLHALPPLSFTFFFVLKRHAPISEQLD